MPGWEHETGLRPMRRLFWMDIVAKALVGDLNISGRPAGASTSIDIETLLLQTSEPDFTRDKLATDAGVFADVMVRPSTVLADVRPTAAGAIQILLVTSKPALAERAIESEGLEDEVQKPVASPGEVAARLMDERVGRRINERRRQLGLTADALGKMLGDNDGAQVEMNESGALRVTAVRLALLRVALDVPLSFFFMVL